MIFENSFDQFSSVNVTLVPPAIGPYDGLQVTDGTVSINSNYYKYMNEKNRAIDYPPTLSFVIH